MALVNEHFLKFPNSYFFSDMAKRVNSFRVTHPKADLLRIGIGDVTRPMPKVCAEAMCRAALELTDPKTFRGYGPEQGYDFLIDAILKHEYASRGISLSPSEIFTEKLKKFSTACDNVFYEKLAFKPFYISDMHSSLIDPKWFECVCDVCGGKVKREKKWKSVNRSFRGEFYCKNCDRHFRVTIRCKQFYDRLDVRKTFKEILPEEKNPVPIPVRTEKSEA